MCVNSASKASVKSCGNPKFLMDGKHVRLNFEDKKNKE